MSSQENQRKRRNVWLCSTAAKREFYLSNSDLDLLDYRYRQVKEPMKGRPVKLWSSEALRQAAEEKYGKEEFQAKVDSRAQVRQTRNIPAFNFRAKGPFTRRGIKKNKRRTQIIAKELEAEQNGHDSVVELEALCECIKKCDKEQLEQFIVLIAQNDTSNMIRLFNEVKQVALLPRSKFQLAESNLAKLLSAADDETDSGNSISKEDHEEGSEEDEDRKLNMELEGTWTLTIATPQWKKGEEGSLEVILFGGGLSVNGDISFLTSCIFGDIVGFKTNSSIEDTTMRFETRSKMLDKWYTGALQLVISRDDEGLCVSGSFWPGFQKQDARNTFQFTGRKADISDNCD